MKLILATTLVSSTVFATYLLASASGGTSVSTVSVGQLHASITASAPAVAAVGSGASSQSALVGVGGSAENNCSSTPNSFGTPSVIGYTGSLSLAAGTFGLTASGLPVDPLSWGVFTYGQTPFNTSFGHGTLCINPLGGIGRMSNQTLNSSTVSRSMVSAPAEFTPFTPASTWLFQFWYRNPAAGYPNFNLSDALRVQFAP